MITSHSPSFRLPRSRGLMAVGFVAVLTLTSVATNALRPATPGADAADGRTIEMTTPLPARGYWLPGDETISFDVKCLDGEYYRETAEDDFSHYGHSGSDGFGYGVSPWAAEGSYEVVIDCVLPDEPDDPRSPYTVMDSETFTIEIGAATHLVATVGTVDGECATTEEITVAAGTEVFWCYTLHQNPEIRAGYDLFEEWSVEADYRSVEHTVVDTLNGMLGTVDENEPSGPLDVGISTVMLGLSSSTVATADVTNTGTWSAAMVELDYYDEREHTPMPARSASASVLITTDETPDTTTPDTTDTTEPNTSVPATAAATDTTSAPAAAAATPVANRPTYTG
ncbi:MAG: hypothetical protein ABI239_09065 [Aquihabitans sp.]